MASVFELLEEIEKQPGIFLGWSTAERGEQLRDLETLLIGYGHAVERHGIDDAGATFMQSFGVFLRERYGWSAAIGPIGAIRDHATNDSVAWDMFWKLLREFRASGP